MRISLRLACSLMLPLLIIPLLAAEDRLGKDDILTLLQAGFGEDLIIQKIHATGIAFEPAVSTMVELKRAGATDRILAALLEGRKPTPNPTADSPRAGAPGNEMVLIPAGPFLMGADGKSDFSPARRIDLDGFTIDRYEVTNIEYEKFDPTHRRDPASDCDRCPVTNVSWDEAEAYARSVGKRLPTEAEWEKAARGPEGHLYGRGPKFEKESARVGAPTASEVGSFPPNSYGVHDMLGNVWEWCADSYLADAYRKLPDRNPQAPGSSVNRVVRGGSFRNGAEAHLAVRSWSNRHYRYHSIGFRCAKDGPRKTAP